MEKYNKKMKNTKRDMIRRAIILGSVSLMMAILVALIVYSKLKFNIGVICPFKEIFNLDCPGCGGTRMAVSLLNLDIYQAIRYNAYVCISIPIVAYVYIKQAYMFIVKNELIPWIDKFLVIYADGLIVFGIIRNMEVFSWLAPTVI